ncbi:MAG: 23S rRNA pseudouridine2605 synthase [Glaciecola sp.]|jgi:23S rRNA pseudouridine2605 synthase
MPDSSPVDNTVPQRLQKLLAAAGIASRRASEEFITEGRVTVNGEVATLGMKVLPTADIRVDYERVSVDTGHVYIMLNKPQGVLTTADDPEGRPTVMDLVNLDKRLFPVGRLDMDTEGLLLMTNDGELAHQLMHPSFEVPRTYLVLTPPVRKIALARLRDGAELEDGFAKPKEVRIVNQNGAECLVEVVMTEGRKREVRRLFAACEITLLRLARVAYGGVELGELRQGKWRFLTPHEVGTLKSSVSGGPRRAKDGERKGSVKPATRASRDERRRRGGRDGASGRRQ